MGHLKKGFKKLILAFTVAAFTLGSVSFVATAGNTNDRDDDDDQTCFYSDQGCTLFGIGMCTDCDWDAVIIKPDPESAE